MISRRTFLITSSALGVVCAFGGTALAQVPFEVRHTTAEWRKILSEDAYMVMRQGDTEPPGYSPLDQEKRAGIFSCAGCDLPLFKSETKYESNTGWPSFYRAIPGAVATKTDFKIGVPRKEYHCARCLGHQGHVFDDGPKPTGLRYCNNGLGLKFVSA
ncbi:peptide-methionine (R)-S-oxide reductase MsrB [uncultured Phenylobacterium sp.]|uniref:peptide-methionine (R)-S-oxide reductase MsrB n=1 Tax=uncultured Phenylobacterium sp. TaxID=349273 RepID=UPI0025DC4677|nr:peptide-methionine (R)-S-oxide reductase MsrB [uncultured Phenylobacterium sp.]